MVGRALRPCEGKDKAIIIDLSGNYERLGMPDDLRVWTLDGLEKKQRDRAKLVRNKDTGEVEEIIIDLTPTGTKFIEIVGRSIELTPELSLWIDKCNQLLFDRELYNRKPAWCAYRLLESKTKPPLEVWQYLGKKLGYHHGWSKYKVDEWKPLLEREGVELAFSEF
jgi:superfamily II DNA or RNA helicase